MLPVSSILKNGEKKREEMLILKDSKLQPKFLKVKNRIFNSVYDVKVEDISLVVKKTNFCF